MSDVFEFIYSISTFNICDDDDDIDDDVDVNVCDVAVSSIAL